MGICHSILQPVKDSNAAVSHQPESLAVAPASAVSGECESLNTEANNAPASSCNAAAPARSSPDRVPISAVQELSFSAYAPTCESAPTTDPESGPGSVDMLNKTWDLEGLFPDVHDMANGAAEPALMAGNGTPTRRARTSVGLGTEATTTEERSPKRPRRD